MNLRRLAISIFLLTLNAMLCEAQLRPYVEFDKSFGGTHSDGILGTLRTRDGGFLLLCASQSEPFTDKPTAFGLSDGWIIKLDSEGNKLWTKTYGGANNDNIMKAVEAYDDGYILMGTSSSDPGGNKSAPLLSPKDLWIIKIDEAGNKIWENTYGDGSFNNLVNVIKTHDGNYMLAGTSLYNNQSGTEKQWEDYWVIKIDRNGNRIWSKTYGGDSNDYMSSITACSDGGYILGGSSRSGVSAEKSEPYISSAQQLDFWIVKIDGNGEKEWDKTFGGDYPDVVKDIAEVDGGYLIGGETLSPISGNKTPELIGLTDLWFIGVDFSGSLRWQKRIGGNDVETFSVMKKTPDGNLIVFATSWSGVGYEKKSSSKGTEDMWIIKINEQADVLWDISLGGSIEDLATDGLILSDSVLLVTGYSISDSSGDKSENNKGLTDGWVVKVLMKNYFCPAVELGSDTTLCLGEVLELHANTGALNYQWNHSDKNGMPSFLVDSPGQYSVAVTYKDCVSNDSINVSFTSNYCRTIIPNVITPNRDDDLNTSFIVDMLGQWHVIIYNRLGQTLYENPDYKNDWKGDGLASGIYYYRVMDNNRSREFKGWVQIVR